MVTRVNGGIIDEIVSKKNYRCFKMGVIAGTPFLHTLGQEAAGVPTTIIPGQEYNAVTGVDPDVYTPRFFYAGIGQPVPNSVADRAFRAITERCNVSIIKLISSTMIHFVVNEYNNGWINGTDIDLADVSFTYAGGGVQIEVDAVLAALPPYFLGTGYNNGAVLLTVIPNGSLKDAAILEGTISSGSLSATTAGVVAAGNIVNGDVLTITVSGHVKSSTPEVDYPSIVEDSIELAIRAMGVEGDVIPYIPDHTSVGMSYDMANITIEEVPFVLV
jgi:hypothetical protein